MVVDVTATDGVTATHEFFHTIGFRHDDDDGRLAHAGARGIVVGNQAGAAVVGSLMASRNCLQQYGCEETAFLSSPDRVVADRDGVNRTLGTGSRNALDAATRALPASAYAYAAPPSPIPVEVHLPSGAGSGGGSGGGGDEPVDDGTGSDEDDSQWVTFQCFGSYAGAGGHDMFLIELNLSDPHDLHQLSVLQRSGFRCSPF